MNIYKINNEVAKVQGFASTLPVRVGPNEMFTNDETFSLWATYPQTFQTCISS